MLPASVRARSSFKSPRSLGPPEARPPALSPSGRRRDQLNEVGVRVRWAGRRPRLWRSVIRELEDAERMTEGNSVLTLQFCVNYGGRAEIADAAAA
ncbi:MAG TPA: undecaprenyl diphosphate synthase family protein, partial [Actinospica sp.]|nr:undecaprenyl diphosphate synthase family protein [Actinospica sp.]